MAHSFEFHSQLPGGYDSFFLQNLNTFCLKIVFEVIKGFSQATNESLDRLNLRPKKSQRWGFTSYTSSFQMRQSRRPTCTPKGDPHGGRREHPRSPCSGPQTLVYEQTEANDSTDLTSTSCWGPHWPRTGRLSPPQGSAPCAPVSSDPGCLATVKAGEGPRG